MRQTFVNTKTKAEQKVQAEEDYLRARTHAWVKYLKACGPAGVEYRETCAQAKAIYDRLLENIGNVGDSDE